MTTVTTAVHDAATEARRTVAALPAAQQPTWRDEPPRAQALVALGAGHQIVSESEVTDLRARLRAVADGRAVVLQAGDCAEPMTDTSTVVVEAKARAIDDMSAALAAAGSRPVIRIGRIGGQFGKPRSQTHEMIGGALVPTYRGPLVNDPFPSARAREHEPQRLLRARESAHAVTMALRRRAGNTVWTSHEALVLDYELPQLRLTSHDEVMLTSAHTIWIGARTNQLDHAHVALASRIINPVGCKVSAGISPSELLSLVEKLNPHRESGKLMLIARMGSGIDRLPALMEAVRREGHQPIWMSDPMHGNTTTAADGRKTRYIESITEELRRFQDVARASDSRAGGVHLETTIDDVRECLANKHDLRDGHAPYTTLCDPRLTVAQAIEVLGHWQIGDRS